MNLNKLFNYFYGIIFLLVLAVGALSYTMLVNYEEQTQREQNRIKSFEIANEIEVNTTSLSRCCRLFIATGDTTWRNEYYDLIAIIRGEKARPDGRKIAIVDSLEKLEITADEYAKIEEARNLYRKSVIGKEIKAMNAAAGIFADENGNYTIKGEPDAELAQHIILDEDYLLTKAKIHELLSDFEVMMEARTTNDYEQHRRVSNYLIWTITLSVVIILLIVAISFIILKKKLIKRNVELEEAYKHLEESEEKYKVLFENSPDGYLTIIDGKFTTFNKSAQNMLRSDAAYILGKTPEELSPEYQPDGRTSLQARIDKTKEAFEHGMITFEWAHKRCDGKIVYMEVSLSVIMLNGKQAMLSTWRDITKRKQIEQELKENEKRLTIAQAIGNMGSWELNFNTQMFTGSRQAGEIYGIDAPDYHELPQSVVFNTPLPEYREMVYDAFQKFLKREGEYNVEFKLKRFDNNKIIWVHSKAELSYDEFDTPYKATGIIQDINDRKIAEEQLKNNEIRLKELVATKDKFFSIISHDLKGPLNALLHLSHILVDEYDEISEEERKSFLYSIDDIAVNAYKLLENLLEWSRLQTDKMSFKPEMVNIFVALRPSLKLLEESAKSKNINFSYDIDSSYEIEADVNMLDTIVRNLVSNSIKFTKPEGKIRMSVKRGDTYYQFIITDNGVGMSKNMQDRLFRIENSVTARGTADEKGTGLGLILCKEMIEKHGGKIWVESAESIGSTFTFTIPLDS